MVDKLPPEKSLHDLLVNISLKRGGNMLLSTLLAELFADPNEISLDELAKRTSYSLSSVSNAINMLEHMGKIKRIKKPGSRKVFICFEKNLTKSFVDMVSSTINIVINPMRDQLPKIINNFGELIKNENFSKEKRENLEQKIKWYKNYLSQLEIISKIFADVQEKFKEVDSQ